MTPKGTIVVPAGVVLDLRTGLYAQIGTIAEVLESLTLRPDRELHQQRYHRSLQDLDRIRSLLDAIGWRHRDSLVAVELDLSEHRRALLGGLQAIFETIDQPTTDRESAAPSSIEDAVQRANAIRALLRSVRSQRRT
jgi:hypothetical protein